MEIENLKKQARGEYLNKYESKAALAELNKLIKYTAKLEAKVENFGIGVVGQSEIGEDIRNKLSPFKNLCKMVEAIKTDKMPTELSNLIANEIKQAKANIEYLANLC